MIIGIKLILNQNSRSKERLFCYEGLINKKPGVDRVNLI